MKKKRIEFIGFRAKNGMPYTGREPFSEGHPPDAKHRIPSYRITRRKTGSRKRQAPT